MKPRTAVSAVIVVLGVALASAVAAASKCALVRIEEWPVRLVRNHVVVDGAVNGRKVGIMLDTGAQRSLILRSAAVRFELPRREAKGFRMFGVGGESRVEVADVDEFRIGQAARKGWHLLVAGEQDLGDAIDVILGDDFFHAVDVEFDLAHDAVRLFQPRDCEGVSLAYWASEGAGVVAIEPVNDVLPQILLTVRINGLPVRAMLDSGASSSVLTRRDAAAAGVTPETPGVVAAHSGSGLGKNLVDSWIGPFQSFAIGDEIVRDTRIRFADLYKGATYTVAGSLVSRNVVQEQPMLLGVDFLRAHRVLVAHSQQKLYFTYAGGAVFQTTGPTSPRAGPRPDSDAKDATGGK